MRRRDHFDRKKKVLFLDRLSEVLGVDSARAEALASRAPSASLRINRLSPSPPEEILAALEALGAVLEPIEWCDDAYHLLSEKRAVSESDLFRDGHVYLQNASSLIPPLVLDPRAGEAILDVCAAPGGKSAHIAALTRNRGRLWVNDSIKPRVEKMRELLATFFVETASITDHPGQYVDKYIEERFDRILLDAQCSGEGMVDLRRHDALKYWSSARIDKFGLLQKKMLSSAFKLLKPGGTLVYSTCTYAPEENEAPIDRLLRTEPDAAVVETGLTLPDAMTGLRRWRSQAFDPSLRHALRIVPTRWMEAFFVCKIVKRPTSMEATA